jgi:DNA repair protein RecO (recombination protein O)
VEWAGPAIVLRATPFGEGDALVLLLTATHGAHRGLVRGGAARRNRHVWDTGNVVDAHWTGRLDTDLGRFSGELVEAPGARLLDDPLRLAAIPAATATAADALPERVPVPDSYDALLLLLARLVTDDAPLAAFIRWELALLRDLGFGLDLTRCAVTGATDNLAHVSPRTGRAVASDAAGTWTERLLPLPPFLATGADDAATLPDLLAGLHLTGHFLARDAFGQRHRPLPDARNRLHDLISARLTRS